MHNIIKADFYSYKNVSGGFWNEAAAFRIQRGTLRMMKEALTNVLNGIVFGVANIIPGVSGGTIALPLNPLDFNGSTVNSCKEGKL